jgi:ribosomal-protein-alanine N-acetyltransferase
MSNPGIFPVIHNPTFHILDNRQVHRVLTGRPDFPMEFHLIPLFSESGALITDSKRAKYNSKMSEQLLRIREYREGDLETLCEIDQICFPKDIAFSRAELAFYLSHAQSITCVAEGGSTIIGFALARIENAAYAHIITLDIVPEARRRGIGVSLMEELHERFRKERIIAAILEVAVGNIPAQRLYEKMDYRHLGTLPGYYQGREDAYRMVRMMYSERYGQQENGGD